MKDSLTTEQVVFKCSRCNSQNVYGFRLDQDWGTGGDYTPVNDNQDKERPDISIYVCENCGAQADDLVVKA